MRGKVYIAEWKLRGGGKAKGLLLKGLFSFVLVSLFVCLYFSRGVDSYLANTWKVSIFLNEGVSEDTAKLFAEKLGRLSFIREARYHGEDEVWEEFLSAVADKERMKDLIGSPVPGYIEVGFTVPGLTEVNLKRLLGICNEEEIVKDVIFGEDSFARVMKLKKYLNISFLASYFLFFIATGALFYFIDAGILVSMAGGMKFASFHDPSFTDPYPWKFFGGLLEGGMTALVCYGLFLFLYLKVVMSHPSLSNYVGIPPAFDLSRHAVPCAFVVAIFSALYVFTSLLSLRRVREMMGEG